MLRIDILRNPSLKKLGDLGGDFLGFVCPKDTQTPYMLRLWPGVVGR